MKSYDFEYDNLRLSDFGLIICDFDSSGSKTIAIGSNITFNTVPTIHGLKHELTSSEYGDCLTTTIQICKHPCKNDYEEISILELRDIMRWLNRKEFHKFKLLETEYLDFYFEASFNVSKIEYNGRIYGLELEMITNRPFALQEPILIKINNTEKNVVKNIASQSDEEGFVYPEMEIVVNSDGDLEIYNDADKRTMRIANCKAGEVIKANYPIIETSLLSHKIQNDFNWIFFRINNVFNNKLNNITISLPCEIKIKYSPIIKVGV